MRRLLLLLPLFVACTVAPPRPGQRELVRALSHIDGPPPCAAVESLVDLPVPALLSVVDNVERPAQAPMAAARCLITRHGREIEPQLVAWMGDPSKRGLARLAAAELDTLPPDVAARVATAALNGPHALHIRLPGELVGVRQ